MNMINNFQPINQQFNRPMLMNRRNMLENPVNSLLNGINQRIETTREAKEIGEQKWVDARVDALVVTKKTSDLDIKLDELASLSSDELATIFSLGTDNLDELLAYNKMISQHSPDRSENDATQQLKDIHEVLENLKNSTESIAKYEALAVDESITAEQRAFYKGALVELKKGMERDTVFFTNATRSLNDTLTSGSRIRDALGLEITAEMSSDEMYAALDAAQGKLEEKGLSANREYDMTLMDTDDFETRHISNFLENKGAALIKTANFEHIDESVINALNHLNKFASDEEDSDTLGYDAQYQWQKLEEEHFDLLMKEGIAGDAISLESLLLLQDEHEKILLNQEKRIQEIMDGLETSVDAYTDYSRSLNMTKNTGKLLKEKLEIKQFSDSIFVDMKI